MHRFTPHSSAQAARFVLATLLTVFVLSGLWELKPEGWTTALLGLSYEANFEAAERWRFILTSTGFSALALILPGVRIARLLAIQRKAFAALRAEQNKSDSLARHDSLTGLYNRRVFIETLDQRLAIPHEKTAVLIIDLDKFKPINDTYGHATGDKVLCEIAVRLAEFGSNRSATVARLGGDEFAMFIPEGSRETLALISESLLQKIGAPLSAISGNVSISATIGIGMSPFDAATSEALLKCADHAMYRAKKMGKDSYHFHEPRYDQEQKAAAQFEEELAYAVAKEEIEPYFQPVVSLPDQRLVGFEILARWRHHDRGLQMPDTFIPIVERLGLMPEMSFSLLKLAIAHALTWPGEMTLALNVTVGMLEDSTLPERLCSILEQANFPFSRLEVEVTEQALVGNLPAARRALHALRARGISVSLDDFGTGYSGIYHLTQLAIDKIKIDRSFMNDPVLGRDKVISAVLALSKGLKMLTTAEGVETDEVAKMLSIGGCDFGQGYLFGKPMSGMEVDRVLARTPLNTLGFRAIARPSDKTLHSVT
ncbi:putative bifunctional diguanylate cyclase/phosphodiesterase [Caballeronia sp. HLA56]